ncbi:MAG: CinA family protein [Gammaproteobacteria bacterium]|nr:CinA family protein [Gammaproteobacteria bacterium]
METPAELLAAELGERLLRAGARVATVESCTGGGLAHLLTSAPGSSQWFERGFVTYSNDAKTEMVGVERELIARHGAVSVEVAAAMAEGGLRAGRADCCAAVTGIAGPGGASPGKPVGTVCFAWACSLPSAPRATRSERAHINGGREEVRAQSAAHALAGLLALFEPEGANPL